MPSLSRLASGMANTAFTKAQIHEAVADVGANAETKRQHEILKTKAEIDKALLELVNSVAFRGDTRDGEHAKRQLVYLICGPHPAPENRAYCEANFPDGVPPPSYLLGK
jgi:hypothetical protein